MTKRQKELEAWWEKIESIDDAGLMIGFRAGVTTPSDTAAPAKPRRVINPVGRSLAPQSVRSVRSVRAA